MILVAIAIATVHEHQELHPEWSPDHHHEHNHQWHHHHGGSGLLGMFHHGKHHDSHHHGPCKVKKFFAKMFGIGKHGEKKGDYHQGGDWDSKSGKKAMWDKEELDRWMGSPTPKKDIGPIFTTTPDLVKKNTVTAGSKDDDNIVKAVKGDVKEYIVL
jgi:hypothetical protein